jgi:hypothetical protein
LKEARTGQLFINLCPSVVKFFIFHSPLCALAALR